MFGNLSSMALAGGLKLAPPGLDSDLAIASAEVSTAWLPKGFTSYELFQRMIERATELEFYQKNAPRLVQEPPACTAMQIISLAKPEFLVEYEAIAVLKQR